jgi:PAS domain S-box-containing protein
MRYISLNRRLAEMNGSPMEEHLGRTVEEMIPQVFPLVKGFMRRALNGESIPGVEITKPPQSANAGRSLLLSYEPARDEAGEVVGVSVSLIDITELKAAEKARYESEQHFRYMIELLPQIPWVIDAEGRALDVSQRWLDISGMAKDEWRGFGWLDALHPADRQPTIDAMQVAFSTGKPIDVIYRVRPRGGDWKRMRSRGAPRLGPHGKIICWYGSLEEVDHD